MVCRIFRTARLLTRRRVHLPSRHVGTRLFFADGTSARVYRETVVDRPAPTAPYVLVVAFRLRFVRGPDHTVFRWESLLNTPLFVAIPGYVPKLWLAHDEHGSIDACTSGTILAQRKRMPGQYGVCLSW